MECTSNAIKERIYPAQMEARLIGHSPVGAAAENGYVRSRVVAYGRRACANDVLQSHVLLSKRVCRHAPEDMLQAMAPGRVQEKFACAPGVFLRFWHFCFM